MLLELLASVPDPRRLRGVRRSLPGLLALAAAASGARSFAAIGRRVGDAEADLPAAPGTRRGQAAPGGSAIRRAFARLDAARLDAVLRARTRTRVVGRRQAIAIDAGTIRGARTRDTTATMTAPHLVAAFDHGSGTVPGQLAVAAKSNETPAVRTLLGGFDLHDVVVTVDAMHTQSDTARLLPAAGGDYVLTVKNNQPTPHPACKALPRPDAPARRVADKGHGRRTARTIKAVAAPPRVEVAGAAQIAWIRRTVTRQGKKTVQVVHPRHLRRQPSPPRAPHNVISDIAGALSIHVTQIRRYEAGTSQPTLDVLRAAAFALSVSTDALVFNEDERGSADDQLRLPLEALNQLDDDEKATVVNLIESILLRHQARHLARTS